VTGVRGGGGGGGGSALAGGSSSGPPGARAPATSAAASSSASLVASSAAAAVASGSGSVMSLDLVLTMRYEIRLCTLLLLRALFTFAFNLLLSRWRVQKIVSMICCRKMILQTTESIRKVFDEMILIVKSLTGRRCLSGHL
jgi:hypothetical protein